MAEERRRHLMLLGGGVLVLALAAWLVFSLFGGGRLLSPAQFAGCYRGGSTMVHLSPQGAFVSAEGQWPYRVIAAVEGEHGDLLVVEGVAVRDAGGLLIFARAAPDLRAPITQGQGFLLPVGTAHTTFVKVPCEGAPRLAGSSVEVAA